MSTRSCLVCNKIGKLYRCANCKVASYCSREHQKEHWAVHKRTCKPREAPLDKKVGIDLEKFDTISPDLLQVDKEIIGCRQTLPTPSFITSTKNSSSFLNGTLPPASSTFKRSPKQKVYVISHNPSQIQGTKPNGWKFATYPMPSSTLTHEDAIFLLLPGKYDSNLFPITEDSKRLEIIGCGESPSDVTIMCGQNDSDVPNFEVSSHLRVCNCTLVQSASEGLLKAQKFIEVDSVRFNVTEDPFAGNLLQDSNVALMRDCVVTHTGTVTGAGTVYVIHCTFIGCSSVINSDGNDPFLNAALFEIDSSHNILICNTKIDESNCGHVVHRRGELSPADRGILKDFGAELFGSLPNPFEMPGFWDREKKPPGMTVLVNNEFTLPICKHCDIILNPDQPKGLHCLPNQRATDEAVLKFQKENLVEKPLNRSSVDILPLNAPLKMKESVERWNLVAPYNLEANWEVYWEKRNAMEDAPLIDESTDWGEEEVEEESPKSKIQNQLTSLFADFPEQCKRMEETFKNSIYLKEIYFLWESDNHIRTFDLSGTIFSPLGSGDWVDFATGYHLRSRYNWVEQCSGISFAVKGDVNFELFGKDQAVIDVVEHRIIQEKELRFLMTVFFGTKEIDLHSFFSLMFHSAGGALHGSLDSWPLNYSKAKYKDGLVGNALEEKCPSSFDNRDPESDQDSDDDMWF